MKVTVDNYQLAIGCRHAHVSDVCRSRGAFSFTNKSENFAFSQENSGLLKTVEIFTKICSTHPGYGKGLEWIFLWSLL